MFTVTDLAQAFNMTSIHGPDAEGTSSMGMPMGAVQSAIDYVKIKEQVSQVALKIGHFAIMDDKKLTQFIIAKAKQSSAALNSSRQADADEKMKEVLAAVLERLIPCFGSNINIGIPEHLIRDVMNKYPAFNADMCAKWEEECKKKGCIALPKTSSAKLKRFGGGDKKVDQEKLKEDLFKPGGIRDRFVRSDKSVGPKWSMSLACGEESDSDDEPLNIEQKVDKVLDKLKDVRKTVIKHNAMTHKRVLQVQEYLEKRLDTSEDEAYSHVNDDAPASSPPKVEPKQLTTCSYVDDVFPPTSASSKTETEQEPVCPYADTDFNEWEDDAPDFPCRYDMSARGP
eukprot:g12527.t1